MSIRIEVAGVRCRSETVIYISMSALGRLIGNAEMAQERVD